MTVPTKPLAKTPLPADVVFHPSWWHRATGLTFDEDFFWHPARRVEAERLMEETLYERFGDLGLGADRGSKSPQLGPVHLAAGYLVSEMLGCQVSYSADAPPQVLPAHVEDLRIDPDAATRSPAWKRFETLAEALRAKGGHLAGDINWGGILNAALDLRGERLFLDMTDDPGAVRGLFSGIAEVIDRFTRRVEALSGSTSISVNRNLRNLSRPVFLHSECSNTMISVEDYEDRLLEYDIGFSASRETFGIHYCGKDPHRFAASFAKVPGLAFLDLGWGGDVAELRKWLPGTFLNIRLDPVGMATWTEAEVVATVRRLVADSGDPWLTGVCCINMDDKVPDANVRAMLSTVAALRESPPPSRREAP